MAGNKVSYTVGGKGMKPDQDVRHASSGRFTKASRGTKPILAFMTRINPLRIDNRLRKMTQEEIVAKDKAFEDVLI